jgi:hypothetical protein
MAGLFAPTELRSGERKASVSGGEARVVLPVGERLVVTVSHGIDVRRRFTVTGETAGAKTIEWEQGEPLGDVRDRPGDRESSR